MKPKLLSEAFTNLRQDRLVTRLHNAAIAILMPGLVLFLPVLAWPQTQWIKHNNNPVLDAGSHSAWDGGEVFYHFVLFDGIQYRMWYTGYNPTLDAPPAFGYATSPDGLHWARYPNNPIMTPIPGSWEKEGLYEPVVLYDGVSFRMWYSANSSIDTASTGYAVSSDGINWTRYPGNPIMRPGPAGSWDAAEADVASILLEGTTYKMWYIGSSGNFNYRIGYATSSDGLQWTKYANNPVLDVGPSGTWDESIVFTPDVHFDGLTYEMWYHGFNRSDSRIGHATSLDGIHWTKDPTNPIIHPGAPGTWESRDTGHPRVLIDGNTRKMWYIGGDGQFARIGYANTPLTHDIMMASIPAHLRQMPILASVAPKVALMNAGSSDESNLSVACQIDSAGVIVYSDRQDVVLVQSLVTREITFKNWHLYGANDYQISFFTMRLASDENVFNDTLRAKVNVSNLLDDFEVGFGKWISATGWGINEQRSHSGRFSMDDSPQGNYGNNVNSSATCNLGFDLSRQQAAYLSYWSWDVFQPNDYGYIEVSTDSGATWNQLGARHEGVQRSWAQEYRSLTLYCGPGFKDVRIRFRIATDASGVFPGWNLDEIEIHEGDAPTAVAERVLEGVPQSYALLGNYPNPFNPETTIEYQLPRAGQVNISVYNSTGELVRTLLHGYQPAGNFKLHWDGKDENGNHVASGVYLYRLRGSEFSATKKMILMR
jgi:predicted GH43/DUF377 family glycosyl hydrolase